METTRRHFFSFLATLPLIGSLHQAMFRQRSTLEPTPECDEGEEPTAAQMEGPYFTPHSPERSNLRENGITGTSLVITGRVINTNCQPVAKALLDWWHCDEAGRYDNEGLRLRGHHYTNDKGIFRLETIVPGIYSGRTRHLHVKVQAPGKPMLTTQVYFPNEPENKRDGIFNAKLLLATTHQDDQVKAGFTFVLKV